MDLMHLVVSGDQRGEKGRWLLTATSTTRDADNARNIGNLCPAILNNKHPNQKSVITVARTHVTSLQLQLPNPLRNSNHSTVADKEVSISMSLFCQN
eukprot:8144747-Ditylum_brightwellii.AAC.1